jgi:hypothetical protein
MDTVEWRLVRKYCLEAASDVVHFPSSSFICCVKQEVADCRLFLFTLPWPAASNKLRLPAFRTNHVC